MRFLFLLVTLFPLNVPAQVYGPYAYSSGIYNYTLKSTFTSVWGGSAMQWQIDIENTGTPNINMDHAAVWMSSATAPSFNNYAGLGGVSWPDALNRNMIVDIPNSIYQDTIILPTGSWVSSNLSQGNTFSIQYVLNVTSLTSSEKSNMAQSLQFYAFAWPQPNLFVPITINFTGNGGNSVNVKTKKNTSSTYSNHILSSGDNMQLSANSQYEIYAENFTQGSTSYISNYTSSSPLTFSTSTTTSVTLPFSSTTIPVANIPVYISGLPSTASTTISLNGTSSSMNYNLIVSNGISTSNQIPIDNYNVSISKYVDELNNKIYSPCFQSTYSLTSSPNPLLVHFSECTIEPFGVPGWPKYLAMGTVTQPAQSMDAGLQATPLDAIFKYSGNDGAGDRGLSYLTNPSLQNATIGTILQARRLEHYYDSVYNTTGLTVMPVMIHYTANGSGGGTVGAAPDILDTTNLRIHYINLIKETQIMLSYKDSTHPYPGTLIIDPDLLGALQQDNSSQNTFPPYNYNNPSNYNANLLKSKVYVNTKLAEAFIACGLPTTGLPIFADSLTGYFQSINYLVHHVGQNSVLVSWQENLWATGSANWIHTSATGVSVGTQVVNFLKDSLKVFTGTYKPDFFTIDRYERDCFSPGTSGSYAYNATKWQKTLEYAGHIAKGVNLPLMLWQFPGGHLVHKDSAIINYDLANHASACGTWFLGEPSIGTNLSNIKSAELNINIPPGNYGGASTVQALLLQDGGYNWGQSQLQKIAQDYNVFAILWGGGSTTGVSNIGTNGYDDGWLANKLRDYHLNAKVYKTDSTCGLNDSTITIKLFLQGFYSASNSMSAVLMNQGIGNSNSITDTITIELRAPSYPFALIASNKAIVDTGGIALLKFSSSLSGSYYIVVKHRNSIETWSSQPVTIGNCEMYYDFSIASNQSFDNNETQVSSNVWAFYSGDVNQDGTIDIFDFLEWDVDNQNFNSGYYSTDLNGDGNVDIFDFLIWDPNNQNFVGVIVP